MSRLFNKPSPLPESLLVLAQSCQQHSSLKQLRTVHGHSDPQYQKLGLVPVSNSNLIINFNVTV